MFGMSDPSRYGYVPMGAFYRQRQAATVPIRAVEPPAAQQPKLSPPPFDPDAKCAKCGAAATTTRFCGPGQRADDYAHVCTDDGEHMHRRCLRCQAMWMESPLDRVRREALERCAELDIAGQNTMSKEEA